MQDSYALHKNPQQLSLSLWSLRHRIIKDVNSILLNIKYWGISRVEIAGFFAFDAFRLKKSLDQHGMKVCSLVAPPINKGRDIDFYIHWAKNYLPIFNTNTLVLQSLPENFSGTESADHVKNCDAVCHLLIELSEHLNKTGILLSYHCFPYDFIYFDDTSVLSKLKRRNVPENFGLQMDTYWLRMAKVEPSTFSDYNIHSVHLNERNPEGNNCILGTDAGICENYIRPLLENHAEINWILENDSATDCVRENDKDMIDTIRKCVETWPDYYQKLIAKPLASDILQEVPKKIPELPYPRPLNNLIIETIPENYVYEIELNEVFTEYLFGDKPLLESLDSENSIAEYYVDKRISPWGSPYTENFRCENELYEYFWPNTNPGKQVIQIVGGAGSGKSTFIRFFFQYFLPNYSILVEGAEKKSYPHEIQRGLFQQHILLYADLRLGISDLWEKLGRSLYHIADINGLALDPFIDSGFTEKWLKTQITRFASLCQNGNRKWYISWILDNTDQLSKKKQAKLVEIIFRWIPNQASNIAPSEPVIDGQHRELWRIIIPIRPETSLALEPKWKPLINRKVLKLDPIDHEVLMNKRGDFLFNKVESSTKNPNMDIWEPDPSNSDIYTHERPLFNIAAPSEAAAELRESIIIAHGGKGDLPDGSEIPDEAKPIFNELVGDSARRRICLVRQIFSSPTFHVRRRQHHLSPFFFFEALIRGKEEAYNPEDNDNLILNLFAMGFDNDKFDPYSVFVGLHSVYLLSQRKEWKYVKSSLIKIGYHENHLKECKKFLKSKDIIKESSGHTASEFNIAGGHWKLLLQRAYIDNMAVACARKWKTPDKAIPTDPLRPESLLRRLQSSVWFLSKVWEAEQALRFFPKDPEIQRNCGIYNEWADFRKDLELPPITKLISFAYFRKLDKKLPTYHVPREIILRDQESWDRTRTDLEKIVKESSDPKSLEPRPN